MGRRKRGAAVIVAGLAVACAQEPSGGTPERTTEPSNDEGTVVVTHTAEDAEASPVLDLERTHACLLTLQGGLWCWGNNQLGQLGVGGAPRVPVPAPVSGSVRDVALGSRFTCVCETGGAVRCWGNRAEFPAQPEVLARPRRVPVPPCRAVVAGRLYACALSREGSVDCWGQWPHDHTAEWDRARRTANPRGDLAWHDDPIAVKGLAAVRTLVAGPNHLCAIDAQEKLYCWGANELGQVSDGAAHGDVVAVALEGVRDVAVGYVDTCALSRAGLSCWGRDPVAVCPRGYACYAGDLSACRRGMPASVTGVPDVSGPRAGLLGTCGLSDADDLVCWRRAWERLGDLPRRVPRRAPLREPTVDARGVVTFDIDGDSGCLLNEQGEVRCWGPILGAPRWGEDRDHNLPDELLVPPGAVVLEIHGDRVEPRELP